MPIYWQSISIFHQKKHEKSLTSVEKMDFFYPKFPYRYQYWYFKIVLIDIDIDIFKIVLIAISIFSRMALLILISIFSRLSFLMSILISIFVKSVDISTIAISYRYIANRARCGCTPTCLVSEIRYLFYNIVDGVYHENGILHQFLRSIKTTMRNMTPT